jgi:tRNA(Arg) A34 adenosine deaminase TadA
LYHQAPIIGEKGVPVDTAQEAAWMRAALREARRNCVRPSGGPFGACIVRGGEVVAVARNTVLARDATCHAEVNAIRLASRRLGTHDLSGCEIYSTTEPCPMCFAAIHWAGIGRVVYGTRIADAARLGFRELTVSTRRLRSLGGCEVRLVPGFLRPECLALLREWEARQGRGAVY